MSHLRCLLGAVVGALVAVAAQAWAQEAGVGPAPATVQADPTATLISQLLAGGGLPAVLAALGWWLGRGGLVLTVRLHEDDRRLLDRSARRVARAVEEPDPRRRDDSDSGTSTPA